MKIITDHWLKPIPMRQFDWEAIDADTHDDGRPTGFGATEAEAIADLLEKLES